MLVLTRRKSEAIRIGNDVFIKVIRTGRSTVKIGIDAPASVRVVRGELVITSPHDKGDRDAGRTFRRRRRWTRTSLDATCSDQFPEPHIVCRRAFESAHAEAGSTFRPRNERTKDMFRKIHESLSQKSLAIAFGLGDRVAASLGAVMIAAALLLLTAGTAAAEPTRSAWRDRLVALSGRSRTFVATRGSRSRRLDNINELSGEPVQRRGSARRRSVFARTIPMRRPATDVAARAAGPRARRAASRTRTDSAQADEPLRQSRDRSPASSRCRPSRASKSISRFRG